MNNKWPNWCHWKHYSHDTTQNCRRTAVLMEEGLTDHKYCKILIVMMWRELVQYYIYQYQHLLRAAQQTWYRSTYALRSALGFWSSQTTSENTDQERFLDKSSQQQLISCFHQQFLLRSSRFKWAWELKMRPPILNPTGPGYARTVLISLPFYLCLSSKLYSPEVCVWILFKFQKISNKEDEITRREAHTHTHTHTFWRELQTKTHHIQSKSLRSGCKIGIFFSSYRLLIITRFKRDHFKKTKKDS